MEPAKHKIKQLLTLLSMIFSLAGLSVRAQQLVNTYADDDQEPGYASNSLYTYSDSTFLFLWGGCLETSYTTGRVAQRGEQLILIQDAVASMPELHFVERRTDTCSVDFTPQFRAQNGKQFKADWNLVAPGAVQGWTETSDTNFVNYTNVRSMLVDDPTKYGDKRPECVESELVLTGFYRSFGQVFTYPVPKNLVELEVQCNLPYELLQKVVLGEMRFKRIKSKELKVGGQRFQVE